MPLQATSGAASYDAFGGGVPVVPAYIEEVFSTYLYTGNGSTQTITNNIDLSTKGGLVWVKDRTSANDNVLVDTVRGAYNNLKSNTTDASASLSTIEGFNTTGFNLGGNAISNTSSDAYVSWTLRKQPKFFDIVTFSGNGSNRTISHNLGSTPGCIFVKCTSQDTGGWQVYHSGMTSAAYSMNLNGTGQQSSQPTVWNSTAPTSTVFSVGTAATVNQSGDTYIAYLFASNAGGFGLTGTDNVISCGSLTADNPGGGAYAGGATVNLGYEPQFVMLKEADSTDSDPNWIMVDTSRGYRAQETSGSDVGQQRLRANTAGAEGNAGGCSFPTATGFSALQLTGGATYIYIAIRRGPMAVPTVGTSVFAPVAYAGAGAGTTYTTNFPVDMTLVKSRTTVTQTEAWDRLRGGSQYLLTDVTDSEANFGSQQWLADRMTSIKWNGGDGYSNSVSTNFVTWNFKRAPTAFDVCAYIGTGSNTTITHNLGAIPELIIVKRRDTTGAWDSYCSALANTEYIVLNTTAAKATGATRWNSTTPTSSVFSVGTSTTTNASAGTYVAYLFATCAGVSKVGSYTGTGTTLQIDCGFTGGARFVLIKRTDSTGDWYVWDSARGITSGNDPYLLLNTTAAEVTSTDYVDTYNAGFEISSTAPAAINASAGTFVFLAVA
jgi:hypothetical protein